LEFEESTVFKAVEGVVEGSDLFESDVEPKDFLALRFRVKEFGGRAQ
jgi:hypothetical protein